MPTRKFPSSRSNLPPSIAQIHPIQSPSYITPRNHNNPFPRSRSWYHHLRAGCTAYAARRGAFSRMGAPVRPARDSIIRLPQYTYDHQDPSATWHVGVVHSLTHHGARNNHNQSWHPIQRTPTARTRTCVCRSDGKNCKLPTRSPISSTTIPDDDVERSPTETRLRICRLDQRARQSRRIRPSALRLGNAHDVHVAYILRRPQNTTHDYKQGTILDCRRRLDADAPLYKREIISARWCISGASRRCGFLPTLIVYAEWEFDDSFAAI